MNVVQTPQRILSWLRTYASYGVSLMRPRAGDGKGRVDAGDIRVYYRASGQGEPVLLLHGGFAFAESWAGQIPALARHYRVIAPDSRGHGRTTLGTRPITYRQMAEDAAALIEALELGPVHLIGWSDGGSTGLALALQRPDLVRSIVLFGTAFSTENYTESAWSAIEGFLRQGSSELLALKLVRRLLTPEPHSWPRFLEEMSRMWRELPDFTVEELGRIEAPTLVFACDRDEFLSFGADPYRIFKETAAAIPHAKLEFVPGGTHEVLIERAKTVNQKILDFLGQV